MAITREDHAGWMVVCNGCGECVILDVDRDAEFQEVVEEVKSLGYRIRDESYKLPAEGAPGLTRKIKVPYWTHTCRDCQKSSPRPEPRFQPPALEVRRTRPYLLGREAAKQGKPRDQNPMGSDSGIERWYLGYDEYLAGEPG